MLYKKYTLKKVCFQKYTHSHTENIFYSPTRKLVTKLMLQIIIKAFSDDMQLIVVVPTFTIDKSCYVKKVETMVSSRDVAVPRGTITQRNRGQGGNFIKYSRPRQESGRITRPFVPEIGHCPPYSDTCELN